jgi:hypothetical protein
MCHSFGATELQVDSQEIENKSAQELPPGWVSLCPSTSFLFFGYFSALSHRIVEMFSQ